ncbi:MAG: hypothetical protein KQI35_10630 [Bacteroidetes bacterium]|nr:hypothetical protein [Bacteroidota bacterium]
MKKQNRFQLSSLMIGVILSIGLLIQSQLFSQSIRTDKSIDAVRVTSTTPNVNDIAPINPFTEQPYIDAGEDINVCEENGAYSLSGVSTYTGKTIWESNGDGVFSDPFSVNSLYYPGDYDKLSGHVTLYLYLITSPIYDGPPIFDSMELSFTNCIDSAVDDEF